MRNERLEVVDLVHVSVDLAVADDEPYGQAQLVHDVRDLGVGHRDPGDDERRLEYLGTPHLQA